MLGDGTYSYTWDAEGRQTTAAGVTYAYDGDGRRVEKSSGTLYWYGAGGSVLADTDTSGNTTNEYIFFDGGRIARRDGSGNVYYYFADPIGSSRTITNATGSLCYDADFYPFGGEVTFSNTCGQNYKFAGMERDSETGHDHTMSRQYASNLGRWVSPDPLGGAISNPQSLNRYAYVVNNPANAVDALGLQDCHQWGTCAQQGMPHPISCTNMQCAWQYYSGTMPAFFGGNVQMTCYEDAAPVSCASALASLRNGSVYLCLTPYCGVRVDPNTNTFQRWVPGHGPPDDYTPGQYQDVGTYPVFFTWTDGSVIQAAQPPGTKTQAGPLSLWDALGEAIGCIAFGETELIAPAADASPQGATEVPPTMGNARPTSVNLTPPTPDNPNAKPTNVTINPGAASEVPETAAGGFQRATGILGCLGRIRQRVLGHP